MRVLLTGGTGFIGGALLQALLDRGDSVTALVRRTSDAALPAALRAARWVTWDPRSDGDWQQEIGEHEAIVHLAGSPAVGRRYTEATKREIMESRVGSTTRIVHGIASAAQRPEVLVCASGVDFYGAHGQEVRVDESAPAGDSFLARVCLAWEAAARGAESLGVRVASARIGFVLGRGGGALATLIPIFKAFAGGPIGSGRQILSWIQLSDVVGALLKIMDDRTLCGPVNLTSPVPVTNAEFSRTLGRVLGRPAVVPAPAFALRALYGEGAEPLLSGRAAVPRALLAHGYQHRFVDLEAAIRASLPQA